MARTIYGNLDLASNQLLNILLQVLPSDPTGAEAKIYYNSTSKEVRYYNGTVWVALGAAGTGGPPTGAAGGDLSGTYPSPQIAAGVIVDADVNSAAAIAQSKISGLPAALTAKQDTSAKGVANGYAPLDASNLIPTTHMPPLAINEVFVVASQAAMLALTAQRGDMAIRTDNGLTYVLAADAPSVLANWKEVTAAGQVVSVNGSTGVVTITLASLGGVPTSRQVIAGTGLTGGGPLTGDVTLSLAAGAGGNRYSAALTATASQVVTHNLNTRDVHVAVYNSATPFEEVDVEVQRTSVNTVTIIATPALPAGYRVVVLA